MPKKTSYYAIMPILNKSFISFSGPSWFLQESIQFRSMTDEEKRFIQENSPSSFNHDLSDVKKALIYSDLNEGVYKKVSKQIEQEINHISLSTQTCFNILASKDPIVMPFCILISEAFRKKNYKNI